MRQNLSGPNMRRKHERRPTIEMMEQRELLSGLTINSAKILPDGRTLQVSFSEPPPAARGVPNWMPGYDAGVRLVTNTGVGLEFIGDWVTADSSSLTWTSNYLVSDPRQVFRFGQTNLTISAGAGLLKDDAGNYTNAVSNFPVVNGSLVDASGFTTQAFTRGQGGATIYVSSTYGDDKRTFAQAQSPATPFKSVTAALAQVFANGMDGKGADIRLLRGDTFSAGGAIKVGGQDPAHPFIIEDYWYQYKTNTFDPGTRPVIAIDEAAAQSDSVFDTTNGGGTPTSVDNVVIRRIEMKAVNWTGNISSQQGLTLLRGGKNWTLDDCVIGNFGTNIIVQGYWGAFQDVTFNRCVVTDAHYDNNVVRDHSQGLFMQNVKGILISQCTFDYNGRVSADLSGRDMFSHNIYIKEDCGPAVVWGNYIRAGGSYGIEMRSGGVLAYNYFGHNALASFMDGIGGTQYRNVVEYGEDISASLPRGIGLEVTSNYGSSIAETLAGNIILNGRGNQNEGIEINQNGTNKIENLLVTNNTLYNGGTIKLNSSSSTPGYRSAIVQRNIVDNNDDLVLELPAYKDWRFYNGRDNVFDSTSPTNRSVQVGGQQMTPSDWTQLSGGDDANSLTKTPTYVNSSANAAGYNASLGGKNTEADFAANLRNRGAGRWPAVSNTQNMYEYYSKSLQATNLPASGPGAFGGYGVNKPGTPSSLKSGAVREAATGGSLRSIAEPSIRNQSVTMSAVAYLPQAAGVDDRSLMPSDSVKKTKANSGTMFDSDGRIRLSS